MMISSPASSSARIETSVGPAAEQVPSNEHHVLGRGLRRARCPALPVFSFSLHDVPPLHLSHLPRPPWGQPQRDESPQPPTCSPQHPGSPGVRWLRLFIRQAAKFAHLPGPPDHHYDHDHQCSPWRPSATWRSFRVKAQTIRFAQQLRLRLCHHLLSQ